MSSSLASRLDDLAAAYAQHLITYVYRILGSTQLIVPSDDDYRLLRQDLFQKYSTEQPPQPRSPKPQPAPDPPLRRKNSVVSGVVNLFRRATSRSAKKHLPAVQNPVTAPAQPLANSPHRTLHKPSFLSLRTFERQQQTPSSASHDPDGNSAALMTLITSTEAEYTRLLDAFTSLESSTLKRIQYKTARRLYTPTPTSINVLIEGREWRKHTEPVSSIILPPLSPVPTNYRHHPHSQVNSYHHHHHHPLSLSTSSFIPDQSSTNSAASSSKISILRSFPSLPRNTNNNPHPPSASYLRTHAYPLQRQNSVSSASTQSTVASNRPQVLGPRNAGNLYHPASLADRKWSLSPGTGADPVTASRIAAEDGALDDVDDDPEAADYDSAMKELNDIRRRKEDVHARFMRRLDYLKAELRAAELREHVMHR